MTIYSESKLVFGDDDQTNYHGNYSFIPKDLDGDDFYETINFILADVYAPFETSVLGSSIMPEHLLGDPTNHGFSDWDETDYQTDWDIGQFTFDHVGEWLVKPADWDTHSYNTGNLADPGGLPGPIGCGSMVFYNYDQATDVIELRKFENIIWDGDSWITAEDSDHYSIADGRLTDMPKVCKLVVTSTDAVLAAMKLGQINVLDPQFSQYDILSELQAEETITLVLSTETYKYPFWGKDWRGRGEAIYFNPQYTADTELGANDRPLNKKGVRHAVSHIVPREEIILSLLDGRGQPAFTPVSVTSWAVMDENSMLVYKKTLQASDGSMPGSGATTAYDEYNPNVAMQWLASEGYDMRPWGGPAPYNSEETTTSPTTTTTSITPTRTAKDSFSTEEVFENFAWSEIISVATMGMLALLSGVGLAALYELLRKLKS